MCRSSAAIWAGSSGCSLFRATASAVSSMCGSVSEAPPAICRKGCCACRGAWPGTSGFDSGPPAGGKLGFQIRQPAGEEALLGGIAGELEGAAIGVRGFGGVAETAEQIGAGRGEKMVVGERAGGFEGVEDLQAGLRAVSLGDGDGAIELDDGGGLDAEEKTVQLGHLAPVGVGRRRGSCVEGGDRRL